MAEMRCAIVLRRCTIGLCVLNEATWILERWFHGPKIGGATTVTSTVKFGIDHGPPYEGLFLLVRNRDKMHI